MTVYLNIKKFEINSLCSMVISGNRLVNCGSEKMAGLERENQTGSTFAHTT